MADLDRGAELASPRCPGTSLQDIIGAEAAFQTVPAPLFRQAADDEGSNEHSVDRYVSYEFHRAEVEHMWRNVWQLACREEDIPEVGDQLVYEIAEHSILVVRSAQDEILAYHNTCLHRGRLLRTDDGHSASIRCPFHGWNWSLDGELKSIPSDWDFPHVDRAKFCLPKVHVGRWNGFVFVNMAKEPQPFEAYLGVLPEHFTHWPNPAQGRRKVAHVAAIVDCNWKVAMEAFIEGYHGPATHPQMAFYVGDVNTQYDVFGPTVSRMVSPQGVQSPVMRSTVDVATIVRTMAHDLGVGDPDAIVIPEGADARTALASHMRAMMAVATGSDMTNVSNSELLEAVQYHLFPNIMPWAGVMPMVYRFRPNGDDPDSCVADIMLLMPAGPNGEGPVRVPIRWLPRNPDWREAFEFGALGPIFNQDMQNLPFVQKGMKAAQKRTLTISRYQESRIRRVHATIDRYLER
ncbi:aromatic ring-hydroxylating oxygenase subunit alpha [Novosphingobium sp.]|uniref:aromatic ring-hydroxylating oxygenase subunit alpha n=1 Tax=Novosphingobium sp. TaxID=1874826 RepID=UPI003BABAF2F